MKQLEARINGDSLKKLALALVNGNYAKASELSTSALNEEGYSTNDLLEACYEGAKTADDLFSKNLIERADMLLTCEAYLRAIRPIKPKLNKFQNYRAFRGHGVRW